MVRGTCIFKTSGQNTFTVDQRGLKRESRNLPLVEYKLEELTKRVDKHNNVVERTYSLEQKIGVQEEQIKVVNHRIADLEK